MVPFTRRNKIRIGIVFTSRLEEDTGLAAYENLLNESLQLMGNQEDFDLVPFVPRKRGEPKKFLVRSKEVCGYNTSIVEKIITNNPTSVISFLLRTMKGPFERSLIRQKIDVAYFASPSNLALCLADIPHISTVWDLGHLTLPGFAEFSNWKTWAKDYLFFRVVLPRSIAIFTDGLRTRDSLVELSNIPRENIFPIGNFAEIIEETFGSHTTRRNANRRNAEVFFPAADWPHKNHVNVIKAIGLLKHRGIFVRLILSGKRLNDWANLSGLAQDLEVAEQIHDLGFIPESEVRGLMGRAGVVIIPTLLPSTSLPALESLAAGTPIVISDTNRPPGTSNTTGIFWIDPISPESIADAIQQALDFTGSTSGSLSLEASKSSTDRLQDALAQVTSRIRVAKVIP